MGKLNIIILKQLMSQRTHNGNYKINRYEWNWKHNIPKIMRCSESSVQREFYSYKFLYLKIRKTKINNLTVDLKELEWKSKLKSKLAEEGHNKD